MADSGKTYIFQLIAQDRQPPCIIRASGSLASNSAIPGEAAGAPASTAGEYQNQTQDVRHRGIGRLMIQPRTIWHIPRQVTH